jgi:hypothetical protein
MQSLHDLKGRYSRVRPILASPASYSTASACSAIDEVKNDAEFSFADEDEPGTLAFHTENITAVRVLRQHSENSHAFILGPVFTVPRAELPTIFNENAAEYPQAALELLGELEPDGCTPTIPALFRECITERWRQREQFPDHPPTVDEIKTGYITDLFLNKFCGVQVSSSASADARYAQVSLRTTPIPEAERVKITERELWLLRVMMDIDTSVVNRFVLNRAQSEVKLAAMGEGSWLLRASSIGDSADGLVTVRVVSFRKSSQIFHQLIAQVAGLGYIIFIPGFPGCDNEAVADFRVNGMPTQHEQKFITISGMYPSFVDLLSELSKGNFDLAKFVM